MEPPLESDVIRWKQAVTRLVDPYNKEVPDDFRDDVVRLAASGDQKDKQEAFERIRDELIKVKDPDSHDVQNKLASESVRASREPAILAWLAEQVAADDAARSATAAFGASTPLTHVAADGAIGARPPAGPTRQAPRTREANELGQ